MEASRSVSNLVVGVLRVVLVLSLLVVSGLLIDLFLKTQHAATLFLVLAGASLLALGVALEAMATRALWKFGLGTPNPIEPPQNLVTSGPYRISRNPLYVARLLVLTGTSALLASPGVAVVALGLLVLLEFVLVPKEETRLVGRYGLAYETYRKQVRRWMTFGLALGRNK